MVVVLEGTGKGGGALVGDETKNLLLSAELLKWIYLGEDIKWVINLFIRIKYMWRKFSAKPMYICKLLPRVNHYAILAS